MNFKKIGYISIFLLVGVAVLACGLNTKEEINSNDKNKWLLEVLVHTLKNYHYNPQTINDEFSENVYKKYIKSLDYNKLYFYKSDIEKLDKFKTVIDDQINNKTFEFFELSDKIIVDRIKESETFVLKVLDKPFKFDKKDEVQLDSEKLEFADNKKDLQNRWTKLLRLEILKRAVAKEESQKKAKAKNDTVTIKSWKELEIEARAKVLKSYKERFHRLTQLNQNDRFSYYLNSITGIFDPHTNYFPPKDKENFDIEMSGRLEGIGATLQQKDGHISVTQIVPGSASWKQGELEAGDIIFKVGQGAAEPVSIEDMRLDDAVKLIRGKKGTEVRLTIRKLDGSENIIPIIRDVVILEATYAKSAIVTDKETKKKIGLINLPKFYADFTGSGGRTCSKDVKEELRKLKAENVDGVVIDLRMNGGGSLQDVVDMGGLFIDKGPIVQVKQKSSVPEILADDDDGELFYDGPLVILVSQFSASASEILAAAMQDYSRAIIIGTPTYGKGTVQSFVSLDQLLPSQLQHIRPLGAVKITISNFYRINGGSTQQKGVTPDIIIPTEFNYAYDREKKAPYSLPWNEITSATYKPLKGYIGNLSTIKTNSEKRVKANTTFQLIEDKALYLKNSQDDLKYPLALENYQTKRKQDQLDAKKYEKIQKENIEFMKIAPIQEDWKKIESDSSRTVLVEAWHKKLKKDATVAEALKIINEIIEKK